MTCIIGLVHEDGVYIGGDSAGLSGYSLTHRADPKVFHNGPFLIGYTSSYRMGQLLRFGLIPPPHHPDDLEDFAFMVTTFVDAVRSCLKTGGFAKTDNGVDSGGSFLVAYRRGLYEVSDDFQVGQSLDAFAAVGCGSEVAHGAMYATEGRHPEDRIRTALKAAQRFSAGVCEPWVIERSAS